MIKKFSTLDNDFDSELDSLIAWDSSIDEESSNSVKKSLVILGDMVTAQF